VKESLFVFGKAFLLLILCLFAQFVLIFTGASLMLVGWGGNNGSTVTASIIANRKKLSWRTREGTQSANYFGSVVLASTLKLGIDEAGKDVYIPFSDVLPMAHPNDFVVGGWDINQ
jgi:myo-inositol-1-phosphate synthase